MTTEELKNAAGFKAVDAEGNELGVVSLSDIVSAVKQELQPSGVARASVAALSEVSTQAATDTYEDQLPQKTDVTWIRGLDESGNPILISKQSLVSVAEGLLPVASKDKKGLMPTSYIRYYPLSYWGASNTPALFKIAKMKKESGAIFPLGMLLWQKNVGSATTFVIASVVNRAEGIFAANKNLGLSNQKFKLYYKEEGDYLSVYILLENFVSVYVCFANTEGLENNKFISERQSSTDTSGLTLFPNV